MVRTRFAPSPTGYMHIGNLRTALYTYLFARSQGGKFILRIEDTDQERMVEGAVDVIYHTLKMCGFEWDEGPDVGGEFGPYVQSQRKGMYLPYAQKLVQMGKAYYCFCTKEELEERRARAEAGGETWKYDKHCMRLSQEEVNRRLEAGEPYVIRQNIPASGEASFDDVIYGHIAVDCSELDDMVLIKADGLPTYNFANVIDDHTMGITHVMRGNEYLSSTPKYNLLYEAFGWEKPVYIHLTPVMKDATRKLSKRKGDPSFEDLLAMGYLKDAVVNYISLVGWNPGDNREFFTLDELIEAFSLDGLSKSPAIFDMDKLTWMNGEYIKRMSHDAFKELAMAQLEKEGFPVERFDKDLLATLLHTRTERFADLAPQFDFLIELPAFDPALYTHKKMKSTPEIALTALQGALTDLETVQEWKNAALYETLLKTVERLGMKNGQVLWPVRIALAGKANTPGGATEIAQLLGREESLARIKKAIENLERA